MMTSLFWQVLAISTKVLKSFPTTLNIMVSESNYMHACMLICIHAYMHSNLNDIKDSELSCNPLVYSTLLAMAGFGGHPVRHVIDHKPI